MPCIVVFPWVSSFTEKYLVPMFLRAKHTFDPRARIIPNNDVWASDHGSDPTAVVNIAAMMMTNL